MKKTVVAAIAPIVMATSLASAAEASWRWKHHHAGWHHRHHWSVVIGPRVRIGPRVVIGSGCAMKKKVNRHGEVIRKRRC
jgi:hypothetical protein